MSSICIRELLMASSTGAIFLVSTTEKETSSSLSVSITGSFVLVADGVPIDKENQTSRPAYLVQVV